MAFNGAEERQNELETVRHEDRMEVGTWLMGEKGKAKDVCTVTDKLADRHTERDRGRCTDRQRIRVRHTDIRFDKL